VFDGLHTYISKFEFLTTDQLRQKVDHLPDRTLTARSLRYLIYWIYDNIAYERKQALKGIAELCREYKNSDDFKKNLVAYFDINEITFLLQYISEHPNDFLKWFDIFIKQNKKAEVVSYILKEKKETQNLKLKLQRFLESYKANTGLNYISGIVRLFLNEFEDQDGRTRFEYALKNLVEHFEETDIAEIINNTASLGFLLNLEGRFLLSSIVLKYFPTYGLKFYEVLGDENSLNIFLQGETSRLYYINSQLYGELT